MKYVSSQFSVRSIVVARLAAARLLVLLIPAAATILTPASAAAQSTPKFDFGKPEELKQVEWKVQAKGGLSATTGNAMTRGGTAGLTASRKEGSNKLSLDGAIAYGKSEIATAVLDAPGGTTITAIDHQSVVTSNNWIAKGRYDRFFTTNNSGYASGQGAADQIAGKTFFGGGQAGYSRQLLKNDRHLAVAEIGYDFSYERYVQQPGKVLDPVSIHSARLFLGETLKLSPATGVSASAEAFFNLNKEVNAISVKTGVAGVDPLMDTRVTGKVALTTTLWKRLSVAFGVTLRYDQNPALLPIPQIAPPGAMFDNTKAPPFAHTLDTLSEATLIYTFL